MSLPTTGALSSRSFAPWKQATTWVSTLSIAPSGRPLSWSQPIVGTLNCICGESTLTSGPVSVANFANGRPALGSLDRVTGAVSFSAAAQAAAPTFCCTSACVTWTSSGFAGVAGAGVAVGLGLGLVLGVGASITSPPPWPPEDDDGFAAGALAPAEAGALAPAGGFAPLLADALGAADGGFSAVDDTSPVVPTSRRNRIC